MSDRLDTGRHRTGHPLGPEAHVIDTLADLRASFAAPVVAVVDDGFGRTSSALATALGGPEVTKTLDWRDGAAERLVAAFTDLPPETAAVILRVDPDGLRTAGAHTRAVAPECVIFAAGSDSSSCFEVIERLGGAETAALDRDGPGFESGSKAITGLNGTRLASFGTHRAATVRLVDCQLYASCSAVTAEIAREPFDFCIGAPGLDQVVAALAALTAVRALGGDAIGAAKRFAGAMSAPRDDAPRQG